MRSHLVIPDQHAHPDFNNARADWLGSFIKDTKPDVVVNLGDAADMASLSAYDKGKASFHGRNYERDIEAHLEFQDRLWNPFRRSKKARPPVRIVIEGNHEFRIKKALEYQPELAGDRFGMSFNDLDFKHNYNEIVEYEGNTPGCITIDGITYSHYFVSGLMGRPIGGMHQAASIIVKNMTSCVAGHSHTVDWSVRSNTNGKFVMGLVAGCYQDYIPSWAGVTGKLWWPGVVVLNGVEDGFYSPRFVSLKQLKQWYSDG